MKTISIFSSTIPSTKFPCKTGISYLPVNTIYTDLLLDANCLLQSLHPYELYKQSLHSILWRWFGVFVFLVVLFLVFGLGQSLEASCSSHQIQAKPCGLLSPYPLASLQWTTNLQEKGNRSGWCLFLVSRNDITARDYGIGQAGVWSWIYSTERSNFG